MQVTTLNSLLESISVSADDWNRAGLTLDEVKAIVDDYHARADQLKTVAEMFAAEILKFEGVHSVRWRVKNISHLVEKIIRKRIGNQKKYRDIDASNYSDKVTDLIGIRALHLFKDDCFQIDPQVKALWGLAEKPIAYIRQGDSEEFIEKFRSQGLGVKFHSEGYRSVHYICKSQPHRRRIFAEVQVRTIFEEGWSEIDHKVRYPNFTDHRLVGSFLDIFNRLAGSADEMGTYVQRMARWLETEEIRTAEIIADRNAAVTEVEKMVARVAELRKKGEATEKAFEALERKVSSLRDTETFGLIDFPKMGDSLRIFTTEQRPFVRVGDVIRSIPATPFVGMVDINKPSAPFKVTVSGTDPKTKK